MKLSREFSKLVSKMLKYGGDDPKQLALRAYVKLIIVMARKYTRARADYQDIVMEGINGLLEAVEKFDPSRSKDFKTYAIMRAKGRMYQYCLANKNLVHIPTHIANTMAHIERMFTSLEREPVLFAAGISPLEIIKVDVHPFEEELPKHTKKFIGKCKQKIRNLANNSMTNYEKLTAQAMLALNSGNEGDEQEASGALEKTPNDPTSAYNFLTLLEEKEADLKAALGDKKFYALKLKMQGYNYKEISRSLFQAGYTNREISRQGVKNLLEKAKRILVDEGFTQRE